MTSIPRVVHLIWVQGEEHLNKTQPRWRLFRELWAKHMPAWRLHVWDDTSITRLLTSEYPELLPKYNVEGAPFAWRADIARYAIIHKHGGMYADSSYQVLQPFGWMFEHPHATLLYLRNDYSPTQRAIFGNTNNCWFAATPGHAVLRSVIDKVVELPQPPVMDTLAIYHTTGPFMLWDVLSKVQERPDVVAVPTILMDPQMGAVSWTPCNLWDPEDCHRKNPMALAIRWGNMSYTNVFERSMYATGQFLKRNGGSVIITLMLLLLALSIVTIVVGVGARRTQQALEVCNNVAPGGDKGHTMEYKHTTVESKGQE